MSVEKHNNIKQDLIDSIISYYIWVISIAASSIIIKSYHFNTLKNIDLI